MKKKDFKYKLIAFLIMATAFVIGMNAQTLPPNVCGGYWQNCDLASIGSILKNDTLYIADIGEYTVSPNQGLPPNVCGGSWQNCDLLTIGALLKRDTLHAVIVGGNNGNFIPIDGTHTNKPETGIIQSRRNMATLIWDSVGYAIGAGNDNSIYGSSNKISALQIDTLQTYLQFYDQYSKTGAEINLAGQDASGGNGAYAHIGMLDFSGANTGNKIWFYPDSIQISCDNNSKDWRGLQYATIPSAGMKGNTLIWRDFADGSYLSHTYTDSLAGFGSHLKVTSGGSVIVGGNTALTTTSTEGFIYIPIVSGQPTGTPNAYTNTAPMVLDTSNGKFWFYYGGAWHYATLN